MRECPNTAPFPPCLQRLSVELQLVLPFDGLEDTLRQREAEEIPNWINPQLLLRIHSSSSIADRIRSLSRVGEYFEEEIGQKWRKVGQSRDGWDGVGWSGGRRGKTWRRISGTMSRQPDRNLEESFATAEMVRLNMERKGTMQARKGEWIRIVISMGRGMAIRSLRFSTKTTPLIITHLKRRCLPAVEHCIFRCGRSREFSGN
jgi:hypothetical protein